ncbi:MAG: hypothetical protein ACYCVH_12375 [Ignavibacteriaceae bacterium]
MIKLRIDQKKALILAHKQAVKEGYFHIAWGILRFLQGKGSKIDAKQALHFFSPEVQL